MTDRDALTRAVCATPDDDTPRLILADWLDENGDAPDRLRARFIRVQCEMAHTEEQAPAWRKLYAEERKLLGTLKGRHTALTAHLDKRTTGFGYERGFVGRVTVFAKRFLAEADRFFADDPIQTVKFVKLTSRSGSVPTSDLFSSPKLAPLRTLDLSGSGIGPVELGKLATAENLAGLKTLVLSENPLTPHGLGWLLQSGALASLAHLDLSKNPQLGDAEAEAMAACPGLRRIRSLDLFGSGVTARGVRAIAESPHAAGLEKLRVGACDFYGVPTNRDLGGNPDHAAMAVAVGTSPHLSNLKELDLAWRRIGADGLAALAGSPHLTNLRRLRLAYCGLPLSAAGVVAGSPNFARLYALELGTVLDDDTLRTLLTEADQDRIRAALPDAAVRFA